MRKLLDEIFEKFGGWEKTVSGGIDWKKKIRYNRSFLAQTGVEVQVSARSDLLIRDIVHLWSRRKIKKTKAEKVR